VITERKQPEDAFEDATFESGFEMSNSERGFRVSALHFFVEKDTTTGFLTSNSFR
jgi:hypothetical protein